MSMHQGLDLSKFKVAERDAKTTTLRHGKGHTIKIAHSGLTPKMRDALNALPVHKAEGGKIDKAPAAEGVDPTPEDSAAAEGPPIEAGPENISQGPDNISQAPAPDAGLQAPAEGLQQPAPAAQGQEPAPRTDGPPPTGSGVSDDNTIPVVGHKLDQEAKDWAQDLVNQHITPKTYSDLFAKKDTPGKIGTLFGLLLSGAGSGLAHQQNNVMNMMNKEIENDFEAQKQSKANAQNFLRISQQQTMNDAQIQKWTHENGLTDAHRDEIAGTQALNAAKLATLSGIGGLVDKMPPGPTKDMAQGMLGKLQVGVANDVAARNAATSAKVGAGLKPSSGVNDRKLLDMQRRGAQASSMGIVDKNAILPQDSAEITKEANAVKQNRATYGAFVDSFKKLDSEFLAGKLNPEKYAAIVNNFETALARQVGTEEAKKAVAGMFPSAKDWGSARAEKFDKATEHFQVNESGTDTLDRYGLKEPFPKVENPATPKKNAASVGATGGGLKEGTEGKDKNGHPWVVKNGKRVYK